MNDLHPIISFGDDAQVDDPDVSKASCDHQPGQPGRVGDMAFMQIEAPAFLVGEESFNTKAFVILGTDFGNQLQVGDQIEGLFAVALPPRDGKDGPIFLLGEGDIRHAAVCTTGHIQVGEGEPVAPFT